ncbi:50S ribosomal protein L23, partial [Striga asiatica]
MNTKPFLQNSQVIWPGPGKYMIKHPRFVIITHTCTAAAPGRPNDSLIRPAYVLASPEYVNLSMKSTDTSTNNPISTIIASAGATPSTLRVAGTDMIPAPIMLVDTLNTAPASDGCLSSDGGRSGRRGDSAPHAFAVNNGIFVAEMVGRDLGYLWGLFFAHTGKAIDPY